MKRLVKSSVDLSNTRSEKRLCTAVLGRALLDIFSDDDSEREDALRWIDGGESDLGFEVVCEIAGKDPTAIRRWVKEMVAKGKFEMVA